MLLIILGTQLGVHHNILEELGGGLSYLKVVRVP